MSECLSLIKKNEGKYHDIALYCDGYGLYILRVAYKGQYEQTLANEKKYKCAYCIRETGLSDVADAVSVTLNDIYVTPEGLTESEVAKVWQEYTKNSTTIISYIRNLAA